MEQPRDDERDPGDPVSPDNHNNDNDLENNSSAQLTVPNDVVTASSSSSARADDRSVSSGVVPPYWGLHHTDNRRLSRTSLASDSSLPADPAITLEDHTEDPNSDTSRGLWAKSVTIDDHVVVSGKSDLGAYVVWICKVQTLDGGPVFFRLRYSEFDELRRLLKDAFPHAKNALPPLPPKSVLCKCGTLS